MKKFLDNLYFFGTFVFYAFLAFIGLIASLLVFLFVTPLVVGFLSFVIWLERIERRRIYNRYLKNQQEKEA